MDCSVNKHLKVNLRSKTIVRPTQALAVFLCSLCLFVVQKTRCETGSSGLMS